MPRSLSRLCFPQNGQSRAAELIACGNLHGKGRFLFTVDEPVIATLLQLARESGPLALKIHQPCTPFLANLVKSGKVKMTLSHRDPRDMILSAMDHRKRSTNPHKPAFHRFTTVPEAIRPAKWGCELATQWAATKATCVFPYPDLLSQPQVELRRLAAFLGVNPTDTELQGVIAKERAMRAPGVNQFHRGELCRFKTEMTKAETQLCNRELGGYIKTLGYAL